MKLRIPQLLIGLTAAAAVSVTFQQVARGYGESAPAPGDEDTGYHCSVDTDTGTDTGIDDDDLTDQDVDRFPMGFNLSLDEAAVLGFMSFVEGSGTGSEPVNLNELMRVHKSPLMEWEDLVLDADWDAELLRYQFAHLSLNNLGKRLNEADQRSEAHDNTVLIVPFAGMEPIHLTTAHAEMAPDGSLFWYGEFTEPGADPTEYANLQITDDFVTIAVMRGGKTYYLWTIDKDVLAVVELDGALYD